MYHVIGFSGGLASAVTAKIVNDQYLENIILLYHDTKTEPADNDRFRKDVSDYIGLPITDNSDGRNIWELFIDNGMLGNGRNTMCSRILKRERSIKFMQDHPGSILYLGYTLEEERRADWTTETYYNLGVEVRYPLIEQKITKDECKNRVANCWGVKPPQMYEWAEHANCVPCVKGKKAYWGLIYMFERKAWEKASFAEYMFGHTIFTEAGSLKDELGNCLRLAEKYLAKKKSAEAQMDLFDYPCDCI